MMRAALAALMMLLALPAAQAQTGRDEVVVFAAGSLRAAMTEVAKAFEAADATASV